MGWEGMERHVCSQSQWDILALAQPHEGLSLLYYKHGHGSVLYSSIAWEKKAWKTQSIWQWRCSCLGNQAWQRDPSWLKTKSYHFPTNMTLCESFNFFWTCCWAENAMSCHSAQCTESAKSACAISASHERKLFPNLSNCFWCQQMFLQLVANNLSITHHEINLTY